MADKKSIVLILLVTMLVTACNNPVFNQNPPKTSRWNMDAKGTPLYAYLDENYDVNTQNNDTGRTAVFINDNPMAEGVMVVSQTAAEAGGDEAVYFSNQNTNTVIAMFFRNGQRFPWLIDITSGGRQAKARLFGYEWGYDRFSLEFEEDGVSAPMENIKLSKNVLMTGESDIRLRNMYTALGVYESISRGFSAVIPFQVQDTWAMLSSVFNDASYAAFAITVKPSKPIIPVTDYTGGENLAYFFDVIIKWLFGSGSSSSKPASPPPPPPPLAVAITRDGNPVSSETIHYIEQGEEIIFNFKFTNFTQNTNVNAALYEPIMKLYINWNGPSWNNHFFSFTQLDGSPLGKFSENYSIKIKRNWLEGYGYHNGTVALAIFFGQNAVVNGDSNGIYFWEPNTSGPALNSSVFVIQFTVKPDVAKP